jgi:hypothetical protein
MQTDLVTVKFGKTGAPLGVAPRIHLVQNCSGLGAAPRHLLLTLCVLHNEERGYAFASVEYLAHRLGVDKSTIKRNLSILVKKEKLIKRSLREDDFTKSRKTEIFWKKLHERRVEFVPSKPSRVPREAKTPGREDGCQP